MFIFAYPPMEPTSASCISNAAYEGLYALGGGLGLGAKGGAEFERALRPLNVRFPKLFWEARTCSSPDGTAVAVALCLLRCLVMYSFVGTDPTRIGDGRSYERETGLAS